MTIALLGFVPSDLRLLSNLTRLNLRDRFLGSRLGLVWAIVNPVLMLSIFTFVFGFVFKTKLPGAETSLAYVVWLISGYGPWLAISEGISSSTSAVVGNSGLVKNLAFKTELLPVAGSLMGLVPLAVTFVFLVGLIAVEGRAPSLSWLAIIPVLILQFVFVTGIGLVLSSVNVFVRDTALVLPNVLLVILFLSPIFYTIEAVPPVVRSILQFNPFYIIAEGYRQPLLYNQPAPLWTMLYLAAISLGLLLFGLTFFRQLKGYFDGRI